MVSVLPEGMDIHQKTSLFAPKYFHGFLWAHLQWLALELDKITIHYQTLQTCYHLVKKQYNRHTSLNLTLIWCFKANISHRFNYIIWKKYPGAVVKAACLESRRSLVPTPLWYSSFKEKNVSSLFTRIDSIFWGTSWPRGSELGLRPLGFEFRILCLEGSVISFISPSSGGSPGLYVHKNR